MAPTKFGLFKGRSKDQPELPSTENLLHSSSMSSSTDLVVCPSSPVASTSRAFYDDFNGFAEFATMNLGSDDEDESEQLPVVKKTVAKSDDDGPNVTYKKLPSTNATSSTTLQELDSHDFDTHLSDIQKFELATPDDATSIDANSIQFDEMSQASRMSLVSDDVRYCGAGAKKKKNNKKEEQEMKDRDMWQASNYEVLQHLLSRTGTLDEQIKWEAIATARGLCTLTATCVCKDCIGGKCPSSVTDGDAGLGAAPFLGAVTVGCVMQ